jgi:hypothetical protein
MILEEFMHSLYGVHRNSASKRTVRVFAIACLMLLCTAAAMPLYAQSTAVIDIAKQPITQIPADMTSRNIAIHGVTLGLPWSAARNVLDRSNVPYIFQKGPTPVVYIPPTNPSYYYVLNSSSYEIMEMGVIGVADLPIDNQYLFDAQRWRLTTARMQFFGNEGEYIVSEDGEAYNYPFLGFVLKYINPNGFRYIMVNPTNKPLTTHGQNLGYNTNPPTASTPPPPPPQQEDNLQKFLNEFQAARMNFESRNYSGALSGFRYVAENTDDPLLGIRSIYWMGESYYGMKNYSSAKTKFKQVLEETDIASLRDPAMLMIRNCNKAMGMR